MYKPRNLNPLGIRKLDVQGQRREARRAHKAEAERTVDFWFGSLAYGEPKPLTRDNVIQLAQVMLEHGWEQGVHAGAKATRDRVAEALAKGTLVKFDPPLVPRD